MFVYRVRFPRCRLPDIAPAQSGPWRALLLRPASTRRTQGKHSELQHAGGRRLRRRRCRRDVGIIHRQNDVRVALVTGQPVARNRTALRAAPQYNDTDQKPINAGTLTLVAGISPKRSKYFSWHWPRVICARADSLTKRGEMTDATLFNVTLGLRSRQTASGVASAALSHRRSASRGSRGKMWVTRLQPDAITLPIPLLNMFQCGDDPINMFTEQAAEQVRLRQANGVDECHFYTLNRSDMTYAIAPILGVRAG